MVLGRCPPTSDSSLPVIALHDRLPVRLAQGPEPAVGQASSYNYCADYFPATTG